VITTAELLPRSLLSRRHAAPLEVGPARAASQSVPSDTVSVLSYVSPDNRRWYWLLLRMKGWTYTQIAARWNVADETVRRAIKPILMNDRDAARRAARLSYRSHKYEAKCRGVDWEFTFDTWWDVWRASGKWIERGRGSACYVMGRFGDFGPYAPGNVRICTVRENATEARKTRHAS
jgi:hypothetical protein